MKIQTRQIAGLLKQPPAHLRAFLFHGNDIGLIHERALLLASQYSDNLDDVFSVTRLDSGAIENDVGVIADALSSIAVFADTRVVIVRGRGTELVEACKLALTPRTNAPLLDGAVLIVEARETTTRHAIVKLFESGDICASIGCYADDSGTIRDLVQTSFAELSISVDRTVMDLIVSKLGADRASSRREIEKLALMAGQGGSLSVQDIEDALEDSTILAIDDVASAVADGDIARLQSAITKAWSEEANPIMVVRGCHNYFRNLMIAAHAVSTGSARDMAIKTLRPPVHFKMQARMSAQLQKWKHQQAMAALDKLQDIELALKSSSPDDRVICMQGLLGLCLRARA
jgi:DNA polymerase-3 subunit delta